GICVPFGKFKADSSAGTASDEDAKVLVSLKGIKFCVKGYSIFYKVCMYVCIYVCMYVYGYLEWIVVLMFAVCSVLMMFAEGECKEVECEKAYVFHYTI
ncbi:hypothetical protein LINPERHAP1_LOCUS27426, partial [Linum perenne]